MDKEIKAKWITELRSGAHKQTRGTLYKPGEQSFCCLGVLGVVCGLNPNMMLGHGILRYELIKDKVVPEHFLDMGLQMEYIDLNDMGRTFNEIADTLEKDGRV